MEYIAVSATQKSLTKAALILRSFSLEESTLGVSEVSWKTGLPMTTTHRILTALVRNDFLELDLKTHKYRIGPMLYMLGRLYLNSNDLVKAAQPIIQHVNELTGSVVSVSILTGNNVLFVLREESPQSIRWPIRVGSVLPAHATATGKALLSQLPEKEIDILYPHESLHALTTKTITTKTELKLELERIRKTGISISNQEATCNVIGIAAAILDNECKAVAAMSIGSLVYTITERERQKLATLVRMSSSLISYRLGYQDMESHVRNLEEIDKWWARNSSSMRTRSDIKAGEKIVTG